MGALRDLNQSYGGARRSAGTPYAGIAASLIPPTGLSGPSFLFPFIALLSVGPGVLMRGFLAEPPAGLTIEADENGEFDAGATADGTYDQYLTLFMDGIQYGATDDYYFSLTFADGVMISPAPGEIVLAGHAPTIAITGSVSIDPAAAAITLVGHAPTIARSGDSFIAPAAAEMTLFGQVPTITQTGHRFFNPAAAALVLTGHAPGIAQSGAAADPAAVWAYVLSNGKTAGQNMTENNAMLASLTGSIEGSYTIFDLLRIIAAVAAGETRITNLGGGNAHVEYDAVDGSEVRVAGEMTGSERTSVTLTP